MHIVYVTCKNIKEAKAIAYALIEKKYAVCTNIITKVISIYRWKGKVEKETESVLIVKTHKTKLSDAYKLIKTKHSYDMPEIISWKADKTTNEISQWVLSELI